MRLVLLLPIVLTAGCVAFDIPVREPAATAAAGESVLGLEAGRTTRAEALNVLGEPWLASRHWGFDLWRVTDRETKAGVMFFLYVPIFGMVMSADWAFYVLADWDAEERLATLDHGLVSEKGMLADSTEKSLLLRAGHIVLATDWLGSPGNLVLWTDGARLAGHLAQRAAAGACTLVVGCASGAGCPNRVSVDALVTVNPQAIWVFCPTPEHCAGAESTSIIDMPVLFALDLGTGSHRISVASSGLSGTSDFEFACVAGQAVYAVVESKVTGAGFLRRGSLQARVTFADESPPDWPSRGLVLWRDGRWLVPHGQ